MTTYKFDPNRYRLVKFYSYPCSVIDRIDEYEFNGFYGTHGNESVKEFFEDVLKQAREITGKNLMDNKIAFEVADDEEEMLFFVGYKDNIWSIGVTLNPYMNSVYELDLLHYEKD